MTGDYGTALMRSRSAGGCESIAFAIAAHHPVSILIDVDVPHDMTLIISVAVMVVMMVVIPPHVVMMVVVMPVSIFSDADLWLLLRHGKVIAEKRQAGVGNRLQQFIVGTCGLQG